MRLRRRIQITIERRQVTWGHADQLPLLGLCPVCRSEVHMLSAEAAARAAGISPRMLYRWIEENRVHFQESNDGTVLVCENSLLPNKGP